MSSHNMVKAMKKICVFAIILAMMCVFPVSLTASAQESTATVNVVDPNGYNIIFIDNWPGMTNAGNTIWVSPRIHHGESMMSSGFTMPNVVSPPGFVFSSWNTAIGGTGLSFTATTPITTHMRVYAIWEIPKNDGPDIGGGGSDNDGDRPGNGGGGPDNGGDRPGNGGGGPNNGGDRPSNGGGGPNTGGDDSSTGEVEPDYDYGEDEPNAGGNEPDTDRGSYDTDTPNVDGSVPDADYEEPDIIDTELDFDNGRLDTRFDTSNNRLYHTVLPSPTPSTPNLTPSHTLPPLTDENNYLVQVNDLWYEFDNMSNLLGTWIWDSDNNVWRFAPNAPQDSIPQDSTPQSRINNTICWLILAFAAASLIAFIIFYMRRRKEESGQFHNQK